MLNKHLYLLALADFYIIMYSIIYDLPSTYIFFRIGEELYQLHACVLILILLFQFVFTMYTLIWIKYVNKPLYSRTPNVLLR